MGEIAGQDWERQQPYLYWMTSVEGIGSRTIDKLIQRAGTPEDVYGMRLTDMLEVIPEKKARALWEAKEGGRILDKYQGLAGKGIRFLSIYHPDYPGRLKNIPDAPYGIYVEGRLPEEGIPAAAVIGARKCSDYGRMMARLCGQGLAEAGVNVISGMASGIDGISQWAALEAGGKTYAVLGCGTDICYPSENHFIYKKAKENGAVISEYPPGTPPAARLFPRRNRIISGLADLVLIIEARMKSGTLITADMALEQGREVYAVPGRATDPLSQGCNQLLRQGAALFTSVGGLLEEMGWTDLPESGQGLSSESIDGMADGGKPRDTAENLRRPVPVENSWKSAESAEERKILNALDVYPKDIDCLMQETRMEYRNLACILSRLCMEGKIKRMAAGQFAQNMDA